MTGRASYDFVGKTILITGGAGDIGRATAQRFAGDGAGVVILDLNEAKMAEVAHELEYKFFGTAANGLVEIQLFSDIVNGIIPAPVDIGC
jgi:NAD(P)-dependent dehydrogenase (short-subunit alcohol dehydrogenase family)